jgi:violaxanthin de-epoxidase
MLLLLLGMMISNPIQNGGIHTSTLLFSHAFQPTFQSPSPHRFQNHQSQQQHKKIRVHDQSISQLQLGYSNNNDEDKITPVGFHFDSNAISKTIQTTVASIVFGLAVVSYNGNPVTSMASAAAVSTDVVSCLFQKCTVQLGKCILDPRCLANVVCINTCTGRPDEIDCQIKCGDILDSPAIAEFNKCVISDQLCVPQTPDAGLYPILTPEQVVPKFDTSLFNGRWYITAGQNKLFDIFPCQVHFFTETSPGKFFGKLNWRVTEPDGEFFTRDAIQEFIQDPADPSHLINHDNEYLHYKDDWYIVDYENDNNKDNIPPFAFVYYRGSNDAWDGYGGVVIYTRAASLPESLLPRLRADAAKIGYNFDTDFTITDNTCPSELSDGEKLVLREQFAGKVVLQTQKQIVAAATQSRGNANNSIKAQKIFFDNRGDEAQKAFIQLGEETKRFEQESK